MASGQAFAVATYSRVGASAVIVDTDLTNGTMWINNAMTCGTGTAVGGTSFAITTADTVIICGGHSLNLTTAATLNVGLLLFDGGAWGGSVLRFSAGNKVLVNMSGATLTITSLSLSAMTTGNTITITMDPVIFTSVTGKSLECPSGTAYTGGTTQIPAMATCTVGAVVVPPSVSAPIFSTKEKPAVFSEEVK